MEEKVDSNAVDEDFSFATDDPDLKADPYYQKLLKVLCLLENQRIKYVQQIDVICDVNKLLDNDSAAVLKMIENGQLDEMIPPVEEVEDDVIIDWSKYNMKEDENGNVYLIDNLLQPQTRHKKKEPSSSFDDDDNSDSNDKILVRGREFDETKPETFNQLWTEEEQARLEELLVEYPPERIENRRWAKIAKALGNRTPKQVCSRIQKYFLKLRKAGLVVPGRAPRSSAFKKSGKLKKNLHVQTTFFPKLSKESKLKSDCELITTMNNQSTSKNKFKGVLGFDFLRNEWECETEDSTNWSDLIGMSVDNSLNTDNVDKISDSNNDNYILMSGNEKIKNSEAEVVVKDLDNVWMTKERKLEILLKIKESVTSPKGSYRHFHFKCHNCGEQPLVGIKWHCSSCNVEFCSDCLFMILDEDEDDIQHPVNHAIFATGVLDSEGRDYDYYPAKFDSNNHLDPNYIPLQKNC